MTEPVISAITPAVEIEYVTEEEFAALDASVRLADNHHSALGPASTSDAAILFQAVQHSAALNNTCAITPAEGAAATSFAAAYAVREGESVSTLAELPTSATAVAVLALRQQQAGLPDIEGPGLCFNRRARHRPGGLYVTDFTASEWCQQQLAFHLSTRLPKELLESRAMALGREVHAGLEAEVITAVDVEVTSREDAWAVKLLNGTAQLQQLALEGLTRELFVFGRIKGVWGMGIIDQLERVEGSNLVRVVEHKTRHNPSLPGRVQKQSAALQAMLYRTLFAGLKELTLQQMTAFLAARELDLERPLSAAVQLHVQGLGLWSQLRTLADVLVHFRRCVGEMKLQAGDALLVRYLWQGDGSVLGEEAVEYNAEWMEGIVERHADFWEGRRPPATVCEEEGWKCGFCAFCNLCPRGAAALAARQPR